MLHRTFHTGRETNTLYQTGPAEAAVTAQSWIGRPSVAIIDRGARQAQSARIDAMLTAADCTDVYEIDGGELAKSMNVLLGILGFLNNVELPKHGLLIAIGGGAVLDVAAMAASIMRRGLPLALFPTTLLAQIDAAIGGKNGINFGAEKNLIGGFYHADLVQCDPAFLSTLDERAIRCGLAEAIKVLVTSDAPAFARHFQSPEAPRDLTGLIEVSIDRKLDLLADDPFEKSSRRLLNYGHAFAHLLEDQSGYDLAHGEAVLLGMLIENALTPLIASPQPGFVDSLQATITHLLTLKCRTHWLDFETARPLIDNTRAMRRGALNIVCVEEAGRCVIVDDVPDSVLRDAWRAAEQLVLRTPEIVVA
ncbi:3-dehydroquinate synthase [Sphingomonas baiyangensis]|uniref:3-dehydroquinate synthase n=1 Tax=Sphingomonas baiyangensis TaxID=2572576 RepID=A0A4U1L0A4_9SPHN|nr:3-dehydroquinate synthase family protein [Sphingomonas baiyangensis]TKD50149.1 3-dehydroquinate synthase [Sphingomonas baiyangensis]